MFDRIRNLLVSSAAFIRARRADKGVNAQLSDYLSAGVVNPIISPFGIGELPGCYAGTLNAVLLRLLDWTAADPSPVLWLTGPAGIGKSAVAQSLITHWKSEHRLAASFSFNGTRHSIKSLVPTLACQVGYAIPELQSQIEKLIVADNSRSSKQSFQSQFEKLISNPILQSDLSPVRHRASLPILIVVHGLDECDDEEERSSFLKTIFEAAPRLRRYLKFLIVSRPESDIQSFFESMSIQDEINIIDLSTYRIHGAATTGISDVLPKTLASPLCSSVHSTDALFRTILSSSSRTSQTNFVRLLSVVLVCLQADVSPLIPFDGIPISLTRSDRFMESILDLEPRSLQSALSDLRSLISFRRKMALDGRPFADVRIMQLGHGSLKDFLLDQSRSKEFHVDLKAACLTVAKGILKVLTDNGHMEQRYWSPGVSEPECDPRPAYHNCLLWCYERLIPDGDLQRTMMEYNPIDYLSLRRRSIASPTAVAFFTFACKSLRRFEDLPAFDNSTDISNHLRSHLDRHLKSELDRWVPHNPNLMRVLRASILPDQIDWESFRASEAMLERALEARPNDDDGPPPPVLEAPPYLLTWMFDKGLGYAGGTVERTVCDFFYSEDRAGMYCFGKVAGV